MGRLFESVMIVAALLVDLLLGNYGFTPYLVLFVLFHASECVSVRFAVIMALLTGLVIDTVYCRGISGTPLLLTVALISGRMVLFRREGESTGEVAKVFVPGALMGLLLAAGEMTAVLRSASGWSLAGELCRLVSGAVFGALELAAVLVIMDFLSGFLGLPRFFRTAKSRLNVHAPRRRRRRVRAGSMVRRSR